MFPLGESSKSPLPVSYTHLDVYKRQLQTIINNLASLSKLPPAEYSFHITLRHNILADDEDYSWYDYCLLYTSTRQCSWT